MTASDPAPEAAAEAAANDTGTEAAPEVPQAAPEPEPPSIDITRIEPDGSALVAGQAAPGSVISLMINGVEMATATADGNGKFVALFSLAPGGDGRLMTLQATLPDGSVVNGVGQVAVAAIAAPLVVAEATPPQEAPAAPEADATEVAPAEAAPAETAPDETAPAETAPAETAAVEAAPAEPAPSELAPTEVAPAEVAPADPATDADATGTETAEAAPVEAAPAEAAAPEPAPQTATTALSVTDEGVKVLQSGTEVPAEVAANVSLDVIAYPSMAEVQFGGRGTAGSFVRLYLDNAPITEPDRIATDGSWTVTVTGIEPRVYTLRVDQLDDAGKVTSRFETPFKRETQEALAAATAATAAATSAAAPTVSAPATETAVATTEPQPEATAPVEGVASDGAVVAEPAPPDSTPAIPPAPVTVTVQPGYTLWGIAKQNFGEGVLYVQVFEANRDKIKDPDLIYPGQIFNIPEGN